MIKIKQGIYIFYIDPSKICYISRDVEDNDIDITFNGGEVLNLEYKNEKEADDLIENLTRGFIV